MGGRARGGNPAFWRGREVTEYERKQRLLVMGKREALRVAVDVLPFPVGWTGRVLDIGAGQGALAGLILRRFPACHVTLLDASDEMLGEARRRLRRYARRTDFVVGDFNAPRWWGRIQPPYGAVLSAIALHYLSPAKRSAFFRRVYQLLGSDGWFVDVGSFGSEDAAINERIEAEQLRYVQQQLRRLEGREVPLETLAAWGKEASEQAGVQRSTVDKEIKELRDAGLRGVECVWRKWRLAVIAAHT